jgi:galactonate dehydratase
VRGNTHFVRVTDDTGVTGVGQSACWGYPEAVHSVVQTFREYLIGSDSFEIERHWQHLYRMAPFRGSVLMAAVSAVDISLWDLKGKLLGVPVYELLGGKVRDRIRLHALLLGQPTVEGLVQQAVEAVDAGFTAIKFEPFPADAPDLALSAIVAGTFERVSAVREAVGVGVDLILELHRKLTPLQALPVIESLRTAQPLFVEDPIQIDSISSQAAIARTFTIPLGQGERCNSIWEFKELLAQGGPQYLRADLGQAGGISHCKKIAAIAEAHHAAVNWHNYLGPVLTAASVQLDACVPNFVTQEYYVTADEGPMAAGFTTALRRDGGDAILSDAPGLGVDFDEAAIGELDFVGRPLIDAPRRRDGSLAASV